MSSNAVLPSIQYTESRWHLSWHKAQILKNQSLLNSLLFIDGWMASPTQWPWVWVNSGSWWWTREAWHAAFHGVAKSQTWLSDWTELNYSQQTQENIFAQERQWIMSEIASDWVLKNTKKYFSARPKKYFTSLGFSFLTCQIREELSFGIVRCRLWVGRLYFQES